VVSVKVSVVSAFDKPSSATVFLPHDENASIAAAIKTMYFVL
jgi:hypothetical protein